MKNKQHEKEDIIKIIRAYETETYPNGVGSCYRRLESSNYDKVADKILKLIKDET